MKPATPAYHTLPLHDALPISADADGQSADGQGVLDAVRRLLEDGARRICVSLDRKSTRLNSSHTVSSYAVFCLKKKKDRALFVGSYDYCGVFGRPGRDESVLF